jgi:hypothetical protein
MESRYAISRHNHSRPSVGQVATIGNHRRLAHREIGNPGDMMFKHFEFAIRETPMSGGQLSSQQRRRTEAKWRPAVSQPGNRDIGVFEGKEIVQQEIAIRDFPMRSEPFITRTRVRGSRGIGVRHFGFPAYKGITTGEVTKS